MLFIWTPHSETVKTHPLIFLSSNIIYSTSIIQHISWAYNASLYRRNPMQNFLTTCFLLSRTNSILEKYEVGLFMVLGFAGFSVLIALLHNVIRKYVYGDAGSLDTMFDAGGKVSLSLTAVTVTSQALWPSVFLEMPMLTYLVCHVNLKII